MASTRLFSLPPKGWTRRLSTPEGRWARLGPYYAMFPLEFAEDAVRQFTQPDDLVIDPFCGRGTVPYVAMVTGRGAIACDVNPVAWVYSMAKTSPAEDVEVVISRLTEVSEYITTEDKKPENEFQALAFSSQVLGFTNAARRILDWRNEPTDRSVAAFLIHYLHAKLGQGLSNQLRHAKAMAPDYCVRWWRKHGYTAPPTVNPVDFLESRIRWRYAKGFPRPAPSCPILIGLGDASDALPSSHQQATLIVTSPPYSGVTNYRVDSWLRLWALNEGPSTPDWNTREKYTNIEKYTAMVRQVFKAAAMASVRNATWLIRSDARPRTLTILQRLLSEVTAGRPMYASEAPFSAPTQTALYGDSSKKPGEVDLLVTSPDMDPVPLGYNRVDSLLI